MKGVKKEHLLVAAGIVAAFLLGWFAAGKYSSNPSRGIQVRENSPEYHLINPLLFVDNSRIFFSDFNDLKDDLSDYIWHAVGKNEIRAASVYFRDLNNGHWMGVNEKDKYIPSSMLKVATLLGYLKLSRTDSEILETRVPYTPTDDTGQWYKPSKHLSEGGQEIRTLLEEMIVRSDNASAKILENLHPDAILEIYKDPSLPDPLAKQGHDDDFMSPEEYSNLFRVLYNPTMLPQSYSETALRLLSLTEFDKGLVAGAPSGTTVSHKFGEHTRLVDGVLDERQLHDCGIIYYPDHPYFLCIMTKGLEFSKLEKAIADLSKITYEYTEKRSDDDSN